MFQMLLKPLLGVAGDVVKGVVDTKKAKAEQKVTEIKAKTELLNKQIKGEIDYDLDDYQDMDDTEVTLFEEIQWNPVTDKYRVEIKGSEYVFSVSLFCVMFVSVSGLY